MDNNEQTHIWISKEEYERLRAVESDASLYSPALVPVSTPQTPVVEPATPGVLLTDKAKPPHRDTAVNVLTVLTAACAILAFINPFAILALFILGLVSIVNLLRNKASGKAKTVLGVTSATVLVVCLYTVGPFIIFVPLIIIWQIGCWTGAGSCTTG